MSKQSGRGTGCRKLMLMTAIYIYPHMRSIVTIYRVMFNRGLP